MGNFTVTSNGVASLDFSIDLLQLSGSTSIIGRGVVVHGANDKGTQPLGAAGERVAACVIGVSSTLIDVSDACPYSPASPVTPAQTVKPTPTPVKSTTKSDAGSVSMNIVLLLLAIISALFAM